MATPRQWIAGARPRTLPAAAAPVFVGTGAAAQLDAFHAGAAALALLVALAMQVGVNYANDYSDGIRGTDAKRVGPMRLTGSLAARPSQVRAAAFASLGVGALAGLGLVALSGQWWLLAVGAAAIVAAWFYTGGKRPYGYMGLGEVFVFVFFGLVAVLGTTYTQAGRVSWASGLGAVAIGLIACAILMVNNIRDIPTDHVAGKRTLAVRLGDHRARRAYCAMIWGAMLLGVLCALTTPWALSVVLLAFPATLLTLPVLAGARGRLLVPVLGGTGLFELAFGMLLGFSLAL